MRDGPSGAAGGLDRAGGDAGAAPGARVVIDRGGILVRLADLNDACRAIAGADTLERLLQVVTEAAQSLIGTHQAVTSRLVDGWESATTYVSLSDRYAEYRAYDVPPKGVGVLSYVTRENKPLRLTADELVRHPDWRALADAPGHPPLPDYLAAPLISREGRNIGLIQLSDKVDGGKFTEDDEILLVQVAQMASATLEHVELLERERTMRAELEERTRDARLAGQVGLSLTSAVSLQDKLGRCTDAMVEILDAAFARIWTTDDAGTTLLLQASSGMYTHLDGQHARVPAGAFKIGRIAARMAPHLSNNVAEDPEISDPAWAAREGMQSFAGYPLVVGGRCIGVMAMFARRPLPESTLASLAAIANAIAVAIEQSRDAERLRTRAEQLHALAAAASAINAAGSQEEILRLMTDHARSIIGAHQGMASIPRGSDWSQAITAVSLSDRYATWRDGDETPEGSGIHGWVCEIQQPARMTQEELEAHPEWRAWWDSADRHPPMRGWLAVPLTGPEGENFGIVQLSDKDVGEFTEEDEAILVQLAEIASSAVRKTRLYEDRARVARVLQQSLLPPALPQIPGVDLAARYRAGSEDVGGDFYDVFPLRGQAWGIVVGDVRGKGPDAAALTALARHSTRTAGMLERQPRRVLAVVNEALLQTDDPERFCSAAFLRVARAREGATVEIASGGHPPILLLRTEGEVESLDPTGPLLGLFPDIPMRDGSIRMAPGEVLLVYTDGITEARRGGEFFGEERVAEVLRRSAGASADDVVEAVVAAARGFSDGVESDDAAVVAIRVPPS